MPHYQVTLLHRRIVKIITFAGDEDTAISIIMQAEGCPRRAIKTVRELPTRPRPDVTTPFIQMLGDETCTSK